MLQAYVARYSKKVANMGFPESAIAKILNHIFGMKDWPTFHEGLVDAKSEIKFDSKLMLLEECYAEFEECRTKRSEKQQSFYTWFCKYHSKEVKKTMLYYVRVAAGLGDPPSEFYTNDSKAINSALKQFLGFRLACLQQQIKKFIQDQLVCKAMIGLGQYRICREY